MAMKDANPGAKTTKCAKCSKVLDACTNVTGEDGPSEGDYTLCAYCGSLYTFDSQLDLVPVDLDSIQDTKIRNTLEMARGALRVFQSALQVKGMMN